MIELQRIIQYGDLYPEQEENLPAASSFIKGLRREDLCTITANMMSRLSGKPFFDLTRSPQKEEYDSLSFFLSDKDPDFARDVLARLDAAKKKLPSNYHGVFYATSKPAITSFQRLFFSVKPELNQSYRDQLGEAYFKALLLINQEVYDAEYDDNKYSNEPDDLKLARLYLAYNFANEDIEALNLNDLFRRQLAKSISLFTFLFRSKDKRIKILRQRFLAFFHIGRWIEYIIPHIMTIHFLKQKSGLLIIKRSGKYGKKARRVVEKSSIDKDIIIPVEDNSDFKVFRAYPYIRIKKHHYAITSQSFIIEHMYNSVYFELKKHRRDAGFQSDDEFRQYYTTEFSQKYMFEGYIKRCLPPNVEQSVSGSKCENILDNARQNGINANGIVPPDYYIRVPEGCIIMEYKDALTNAKVKESRDAEKLFADIKKKFLENDHGRHKGIAQILDSISAIQQGTFFFDKPSESCVVYPVLVVENQVYSMRGMHTFLEHLMRNECERRGLCSELIKPLILTDVATLRLYSDYFNANGLVKTFEDYYQHINPSGTIAEKEPFESLISFTEYMKDKDIGNMRNVYDHIMCEARSVLQKYE